MTAEYIRKLENRLEGLEASFWAVLNMMMNAEDDGDNLLADYYKIKAEAILRSIDRIDRVLYLRETT